MAIDLSRSEYDLLIGGERVPSESGERFATFNPATNQVIAQVARAGRKEIDRAVDAARSAFQGDWARVSAPRRNQLLMRLAALMWEEFDDLAELETRNNGKAISSVKGELKQAIGELEFFAGAATKITGDTLSAPYGFLNYTVREPLGVCAMIVPWNYPILLAVRKLAPALAAGNTAVLKPATATPLTALVLGELALEAGIPEGTLNVVTGPGDEVGSYLVSHPGVDKISFTGETATGREIMRAAANDIKRLSLELGGKSPNIVFEDADLETAAANSVWAIFSSAGQSCEARSRLFVQESVHDDFLDLFVEKTKKLVVGDPMDEATQIGSLISPQHRDRVAGYVKAGVKEGAKLALGGAAPDDGDLKEGNYYLPTVLSDVENRFRVAQEEIFGPVVTVMRFQDEADAVRMANDVIYGLAATLWTNDVARAHRVAGQIRSGVVTVNTPFTVFPGLPFGGYKQSGLGREVAMEALREYTELKSVIVYTREKPLNPFGL